MSVPMALMVDDGAPLVNVFWWHVAEPRRTERPTQESGEPVARDVPVEFLDRFADVVDRWGMRGKFSVVPYPAGLGPITKGWPGCDARGLGRWIETARRRVMPRMDITPEILTHARTLDLETGGLLAENEREWSAHQTAATLTPYLAAALRILKEAGLDATGITSPWDFGIHVEADYRLAIARAMAEVMGRRQTWYFLHTEAEALDCRSRAVSLDADARLVSIASECADYLWDTMETRDEGPALVRSVADKYLTEDGRSGRLADLFHAGTPLVFHTHWQSLYSNGRATGLRALDELGRRVAGAWGRDVRWVTCSDLAAEM